MWEGQDAYVIGGGASLRHGFEWELLRGRNTIGCNSAFVLGADMCKIVVFGDWSWWAKIGRRGTRGFRGLVVGSNHRLSQDDTPWLLTVPRHEKAELGKDSLCWVGNTGILALNLALILGAQRVFLLGFDMKIGKCGKPNWHDLRHEEQSREVYGRFRHRIARCVAPSLPRVFPGRAVVNVTDDSDLDAFPKVPVAEHFGFGSKG